MKLETIENSKWLILGAGAVLTEYYLPAFEYLGLVNNLTIVEFDAVRAREVERDFTCKVINDSYENYLEQIVAGSFDCAIILLPNRLHLSAIGLLLDRRIPVLCEKPLVTSNAEYSKLVDLQAKSGTNVSVAMVRRLTPSFQALQAILNETEKSEIQEIYIADGNPYSWVADSPAFFDPLNGGVLADMGVHYLDQLEQLFSNITVQKYSDDCRGGVEANVALDLLIDNAIPCSIKFSRTYTLENVFRIVCKDRVIEMLKDDFSAIHIQSNGLTQEVKIDNAFIDDNLAYDYLSCFVEQLLRFYNSIQTGSEFNSIQTVKTSTSIINYCYEQHGRTNKSISEGPKYFITGASGFIGSALVNRLVEANANVTAGIRSFKTCAEIARNNIKLQKINIADESQLRQSFAEKDYVVHLAYASDGQQSAEINFEATKKVVNAAIAAKVKAVVVLSTMYVYGQDQNDRVVDERSDLNPFGGSYAETKMDMQKWVLKRAENSGVTRIVILNPSCVYGPLGKTYTTLPSVLEKSQRFYWIKEGTGIANYVYIDNLLDAILLALESKAAHANNFIISDGYCSWKEFLSPMLQDPSQWRSFNSAAELKQKDNASTLREVFSFLISNYDLMELINRHPWLGAVKRFLFNSLPSFKGRLNKQRFAVQKNTISVKRSKEHSYPEWLFDLYGLNQSKFNSNKAKTVLGWDSKIQISEGLQNTRSWLVENNFIKK